MLPPGIIGPVCAKASTFVRRPYDSYETSADRAVSIRVHLPALRLPKGGFLRIDGVGRRCYDGGLFAGCRKPPVSVMLSEAKHPIPLNREKDSKG